MLTKSEKKKLGIGKDQGKAILRYARISSRKVKIVLDLIKGKNIDEAYAILRYTPKAASDILFKLLKSAEANATNNNGLNRDDLYVAEAFANQGPTLKRIMPRAQGRAYRIRKRTSHITLVVKERN
ncbi:MAG TPA: 50S ribosomal protein L22 [Acetivibrio sp.]|nr:50S ribosomal protein L22 [Acetivibrio sp.]HPT90771.1 50S ribosomal protein L22 [Acetivibrio sp.]HQA58120.1 50S ribosomal protein L22 [Acetivibrio sp.]